MKVLVVDDEPLAREELSFLLEQNKHVDEIAEAENISEAKNWLIKETIDLVFLDIQLGDENGLELANQLKELSSRPRIIFATAYDQYALDAFNANALDYILKPFEQSRVDEAIEKGLMINPNVGKPHSNNPRISVTEEDKIKVINKAEIIYVFVEKGELVIVTEEQRYHTRQTLTSFMESMDPKTFMQTHRSFLVNLNKVGQAEPSFNHTYELTMSNGDKVPVGRAFVADMKTALEM